MSISGSDVAHRADVDLAAGQEGDGAAKVDGEAALDPAEDHALDALALVMLLLNLSQAASRRARSRDSMASPAAFSTRST